MSGQDAGRRFIPATAGLVNAGYGVVKNERIQAKPRELRVFVNDEDLDEEEVNQMAPHER
jgi:hypothetical protein